MPNGAASVPPGADGQRAPRRRVARLPAGRPAQVTVIGHNAQTLAVVGLFVGGEIPVRVYTDQPTIEEALAPYPGVTVSLVADGCPTRPEDLPPPPYLVTVDDDAEAEVIAGWLPPTFARFLIRREHRRGQVRRRLPGGLLHLGDLQDHDRPGVLARLARLARLDDLADLARQAKHPLILLYGDPDPDAIGASLGLATLWRRTGAEPEIRYTGQIGRYQNRLLLQYLKRGIEPLEAEELANADLVAVVDAQPGFWRTDPPAAQVVIDHHPVLESTAGKWLDLRPSYGATSTMVSEYLLDTETPIDRRLATALLFGITTDTADLKRHTGSPDIAAFEALHHRADRRFLDRLEKSQVPMAMLDWISWGIGHRVVIRDLALVHFGSVRTSDVLVQTADQLLLTCGIGWVVCAGVLERDPRRMIVVFRSDGHGVDVGARARSAFAKMGSAGGHRTMARAEIPFPEDQPVADSVIYLTDHLFRRMTRRRRRLLGETLRDHITRSRPDDPDTFELTT